MQLIVPARVPDRVRDRIREIAISAFRQAGCHGLARVDFFVDGERVLLNELNTMPGFTTRACSRALFEASGIPYAELLDQLLELAFERHEASGATGTEQALSAPDLAAAHARDRIGRRSSVAGSWEPASPRPSRSRACR